MKRRTASILSVGAILLLCSSCFPERPRTEGDADTDTDADTDADTDTGSSSKEEVIVVGAGLAGLAAAMKLESDGCCDVTVLEAQDRVGGRVYTVQTPITGSILEASAQYHAGQQSSTLTPIIEEIGMQNEDFHWTHESWDIDGAKDPVSEDDWNDFYRDTTMEAAQYQDQPDVSLEEMIESMAADGAFSYLDNDREIDYCISTLYEQEYSSDASDNRAWGIYEGESLLGGDEWFPDGMSAIPEYLAEDLDIRLSTVVTEVRYDSDGVTVMTESGEEHAGDRVIVTVSLGVLQAGDIEFDPPLPSTNTDAIERLGMGLMDKLWLVFPEIFWDPDIDFKGYLSEPSGQYASWNYYGGNALLVWHAGSDALTLEYKSDEEIIAGAMDTLRIMYGDDIPEPTETVFIRFDPDAAAATSGPTDISTYSKGSYSYLKVGSTPEDRSAAAASVEDRVFFAGEHTSPKNPALIQGALESGFREADNIIGL